MPSLSSMNDMILGSTLDGFGAAVNAYHRRIDEINRRRAMGHAAEAQMWFEYSVELRQRFVTYTNYSNRIRRQYLDLTDQFNSIVAHYDRLTALKEDSAGHFNKDTAKHQHRMRSIQAEMHRMHQENEKTAVGLVEMGMSTEAIRDFLRSQALVRVNRNMSESAVNYHWKTDAWVHDVEAALDFCDSFSRFDEQVMLAGKAEDYYVPQYPPRHFCGTPDEVVHWKNDAVSVSDRFVKFTTSTESMKKSYIDLLRNYNVQVWKLRHAESSLREQLSGHQEEANRQQALERRANDLLSKHVDDRDNLARLKSISSPD